MTFEQTASEWLQAAIQERLPDGLCDVIGNTAWFRFPPAPDFIYVTVSPHPISIREMAEPVRSETVEFIIEIARVSARSSVEKPVENSRKEA